MKLITSIHIEKGSSQLQDFAEIFRSGERTIIGVADGAGGISGGTLVAETFVYNVQQAVEHLTSPGACRQLLRQVDCVLAGDLNGSQTTGIVIVVERNKLFGASCGDSEARVFRSHERGRSPLTERTKKFLGTGEAIINEFNSTTSGTLVIATDRLWKYGKSSNIADLINTVAPESLAPALANLPRLRSGALPDDIAIVTCCAK